MMIDVSNSHLVNPKFQKLYIFGAGGHGREIAWLAQQVWGSAIAVEFVVDRPEYLLESVNGIRVSLLTDITRDAASRFIVAIGEPALRRAATVACLDRGHIFTSLIHPRAEMSRWVSVGDGVVLCAGAVVTTNVILGAHAHVNVNCTISHDVSVGEFSTLSPGVHVSGHVSIGRDVFVGTGAVIINGKSGSPLIIGDGAIIGAGACVTKSVEPGALMMGVPATRKC